MKFRRTVISLLALLFIGVLVFARGLNIPYYDDDYQFVFDPSPQSPFYFFAHQNPGNEYVYRPIEAACLILIQKYAALSTLPIHLLALSLHIGLALLLFMWMQRHQMTFVQSLLGALTMLVSQADVHAVLSNDTLSQLLSTIAGYLCLWLLLDDLRADGEERRPLWGRNYLLALALFACSLLSKETGMSFLPMSLVLMVFNDAAGRTGIQGVAAAVRRAVPFVVVVGAYLFLRHALQLPNGRFGSGRFDLHLGLNIPINILMGLGQAFLPVSSVDVFTAAENRAFGSLVVPALTAGFLLCGAALGAVRARGLHSVLLGGTLAVLSLFPELLMGRMSELYVYNAMPLVAISVGLGWGFLLERGGRLRPALAAGLLAVFLLNTLAIQSKARLMEVNGEHSDKLLQGIINVAARIPHGGRLILANPPFHDREYSIYRSNGFHLFEDGRAIIRKLTDRDDFAVVINDGPVRHGAALPGDLVLTLDPATYDVREVLNDYASPDDSLRTATASGPMPSLH